MDKPADDKTQALDDQIRTGPLPFEEPAKVEPATPNMDLSEAGLPPLPETAIPELGEIPPPADLPEPGLPKPEEIEKLAEEKSTPEELTPITPPKKKGGAKTAVAVALVLLLLAGAGSLALYFQGFLGGQEQDIRSRALYTELGIGLANITDNSMSVWWVQSQPARGCVTLTQTESQKQVSKCDEKSSYTHLIDVAGLEPSLAYKVDVKHGESGVPLSPYWGRAIWTRETGTRHTPDLVSGRVLDAQNKPVGGATVFVAPTVSDRQYIPLAVTTNEQGAFSVDLAILKMQFVTPTDPLFVEVTSQDGLKLFERKIDRAIPSTFPDIITGAR